MEQSKKGTRCECPRLEVLSRFGGKVDKRGRCINDAVRLVTVPDYWDPANGDYSLELTLDGVPNGIDVPMCAACAAYHEARQKAGA